MLFPPDRSHMVPRLTIPQGPTSTPFHVQYPYPNDPMSPFTGYYPSPTEYPHPSSAPPMTTHAPHPFAISQVNSMPDLSGERPYLQSQFSTSTIDSLAGETGPDTLASPYTTNPMAAGPWSPPAPSSNVILSPIPVAHGHASDFYHQSIFEFDDAQYDEFLQREFPPAGAAQPAHLPPHPTEPDVSGAEQTGSRGVSREQTATPTKSAKGLRYRIRRLLKCRWPWYPMRFR